MTLSGVSEVSACERDAVQVNWVMEQCDPWVYDVEVCALFLSSDCELVKGHTWLMSDVDGSMAADGIIFIGFQMKGCSVVDGR